MANGPFKMKGFPFQNSPVKQQGRGETTRQFDVSSPPSGSLGVDFSGTIMPEVGEGGYTAAQKRHLGMDIYEADLGLFKEWESDPSRTFAPDFKWKGPEGGSTLSRQLQEKGEAGVRTRRQADLDRRLEHVTARQEALNKRYEEQGKYSDEWLGYERLPGRRTEESKWKQYKPGDPRLQTEPGRRIQSTHRRGGWNV